MITISSNKPNESQNGKAKSSTIMLICLCCVAVVLIIGIIAAVMIIAGNAADDGLILNNVTVAGVNIGNKTPEEAKTALHRATDLTYTVEDMVIELPGQTIRLTPADTGAKLDIDAAVQAAYDYGRKGTRAENAAARENAATNVHHIAVLPYLNLNQEYIRSVVDSFGATYNSNFTPSSAVLEGEMPELEGAEFDEKAPCQTLVLTVGTPGRYVDTEALYSKILDAYSFNQFLVTVDPAEAEALPEVIDLEALHTEYTIEPVDATLDEETFDVIPETYGYGFDLEAAQAKLDQAAYGDVIKIQMEYIVPEMLGDSLEEMLFRDTLASYKTPHTGDANRNTNLKLACAAINDYILYPGKSFDYNTVVGKRTAEKGYKSAGAYSGGQSVNVIGGGICQVSSTLYYCTLIADLQIDIRQAHSFVSSYMPKGLDATVSWGGPHFKFTNNTNYPIQIKAWVADGYVHVELIGTDEKDYYVVMTSKVLSSTAYKTITETYTSEEAAAKGYTDGQVIQTPYTGYRVKSYKLKYDKATDKLISETFEADSVYKARDKIVIAIVDPEEPTEPPTEPGTEPPTEPGTEPPTEPGTQPPTEPGTEPPTEPSTEAPTEAPTEPPTEAPTDAPSAEPAADPATEAATEAAA
ncbi:MAG: VanW family protein [Oscillospiraceae bacterium]|nr:VanW family protein [Oscillospiraceae bacterium]